MVYKSSIPQSGGGGSGTVTSVSVVSANGLAGSVATATTTPAITLSTTITGVLKGNGTAISEATAGTDYANASFTTIAVSGQSDVVADSASDTLTLVAGSNITLTTNAGSDSITIAASGGGGTPTAITVANEASDTTCFPAFFTAATGDLGPKTNTSLTFNSSTASLGCTTFVGALTGNADTATTATNITAANEASDTTCFPAFVTATTGTLGIKTNAGLTYNSATNAFGMTGKLSDIISTTDTSVASYQAVAKSIYSETNWDNTADTTAVGFNIVGYAKHSSATGITGVGHMGGVLGYATKTNATGTDNFITGVEGRVGATLGTVTTATAVTATFDTNTEDAGTITIGVGYYVPDQADAGHISVPFALYNAWAAAPIRTLGSVQCPTITDETGANSKSVPALVTSSSSSVTDNTITRMDSTTGKVIQSTGVIIDDNNGLYGYIAVLNDQTGTTYTLDNTTDRGKILTVSNASAITVTLPATTAIGYCITVYQKGAGQITFSPASGATLRNKSSHTKTSGQYAVVTLFVESNSGGSAAVWVLAGDTGA